MENQNRPASRESDIPNNRNGVPTLAAEPDANFDSLWPNLYQSLRQIAARHMARESHSRLLQTTCIVHEAYFRLRNQHSINLDSETEFLAAASIAMRRILIDEHRKRTAAKRGGQSQRSDLSDTKLAVADRRFEAIEIDEALKKLAERSPQQSRALEMLIFGGATLPQIANSLSLSVSTVERRVRMARAWLRKELYDAESKHA